LVPHPRGYAPTWLAPELANHEGDRGEHRHQRRRALGEASRQADPDRGVRYADQSVRVVESAPRLRTVSKASSTHPSVMSWKAASMVSLMSVVGE
jgi:hypothetical protein